MVTLLERINQVNTANIMWRDEDPANRYIGMMNTDTAYWERYGITTAEDFDRYLDYCVRQHSQAGETADITTAAQEDI